MVRASFGGFGSIAVSSKIRLQPQATASAGNRFLSLAWITWVENLPRTIKTIHPPSLPRSIDDVDEYEQIENSEYVESLMCRCHIQFFPLRRRANRGELDVGKVKSEKLGWLAGPQGRQAEGKAWIFGGSCRAALVVWPSVVVQNCPKPSAKEQ